MFMDIDLSKPMKLTIEEPKPMIVTRAEAEAMKNNKPTCPLCEAGVPVKTIYR